MWKKRGKLIRTLIIVAVPCTIGGALMFLANSEYNDFQSLVINAGVGALFGLLISVPSFLIYYLYNSYEGGMD